MLQEILNKNKRYETVIKDCNILKVEFMESEFFSDLFIYLQCKSFTEWRFIFRVTFEKGKKPVVQSIDFPISYMSKINSQFKEDIY